MEQAANYQMSQAQLVIFNKNAVKCYFQFHSEIVKTFVIAFLLSI